MRITLDIADDVLFTANEIAQREKKSLGVVISEQIRHALQSRSLGNFGIHPLQKRGASVTNALIDCLRDAEGI